MTSNTKENHPLIASTSTICNPEAGSKQLRELSLEEVDFVSGAIGEQYGRIGEQYGRIGEQYGYIGEQYGRTAQG